MIVSEDFFSIQGEGATTGVPSYFVRLANCNLTCGASRIEMNEIIKENLKIDPNKQWHGFLHKQGKATWTCDSIPVWYKGIERDNEYLINRWKDQGLYNDIVKGRIHIIWTGGEPTIPKTQQNILKFLRYWINTFSSNEYYNPYNEIETNGTFILDPDFSNWLNQINCSPKLSNSGMLKNQRIKPDAINSIMKHRNYWFKFVISNENDIKEIFDDFIIPFNISLSKVICMPSLDNQDDYHRQTNFVCEMAKKYRFIAGTRLHISSWGSVTGV